MRALFKFCGLVPSAAVTLRDIVFRLARNAFARKLARGGFGVYLSPSASGFYSEAFCSED